MSKFIDTNPQRNAASVDFMSKRIPYPGFIMALRNINRTHGTRFPEARGMMFVGETGVGKTTILKFYREEYCRCNQIETKPARGKYPVVLMRLQSDSKKSSFLRSLCIELGITPNERETVNALERRAITLLKKRQVELVMIDEFHHLAGRDGKKNIESLGDLLKNLMDEAQVPFVLAGTFKALTVLDGHPELQRRFVSSTHLRNLNMKTAENTRDFRNVLVTCNKNCSIPSVKFNDGDMPERFLLASGGRIGVITTIIETAINIADPEVGITMATLSEAFEFTRANPHKPKCNPFAASIRVVRAEMGKGPK
ncbi:putative transposition protein [Marinobacterium lacunae]|uniref:Putative transposition protein n=1 Tax=Marinobacterium lacunae TaxID=1232683 RepID=A0A081FTI8_9GAMM|nr:TniB family NTP-binding protein [Marinobacterium lacunae]KEA61843.1 putative transposition protein [Marinobacterium lacunae]